MSNTLVKTTNIPPEPLRPLLLLLWASRPLLLINSLYPWLQRTFLKLPEPLWVKGKRSESLGVYALPSPILRASLWLSPTSAWAWKPSSSTQAISEVEHTPESPEVAGWSYLLSDFAWILAWLPSLPCPAPLDPYKLFSHSVVSNSLQPHRLQYARLPCPSLYPGVCSNSCPLSQWCLTISSSAALFSFWFPSFPASGSFPVSWLFVSGGQNIGDSASASVLLMNIQGWFPLGLTGKCCLMTTGHKVIHILKTKNVFIQGNKNFKKLYQNVRNGWLWIVLFCLISTSLMMLCWNFYFF